MCVGLTKRCSEGERVGMAGNGTCLGTKQGMTGKICVAIEEGMTGSEICVATEEGMTGTRVAIGEVPAARQKPVGDMAGNGTCVAAEEGIVSETCTPT